MRGLPCYDLEYLPCGFFNDAPSQSYGESDVLNCDAVKKSVEE